MRRPSTRRPRMSTIALSCAIVAATTMSPAAHADDTSIDVKKVVAIVAPDGNGDTTALDQSISTLKSSGVEVKRADAPSNTASTGLLADTKTISDVGGMIASASGVDANTTALIQTGIEKMTPVLTTLITSLVGDDKKFILLGQGTGAGALQDILSRAGAKNGDKTTGLSKDNVLGSVLVGNPSRPGTSKTSISSLSDTKTEDATTVGLKTDPKDQTAKSYTGDYLSKILSGDDGENNANPADGGTESPSVTASTTSPSGSTSPSASAEPPTTTSDSAPESDSSDTSSSDSGSDNAGDNTPTTTGSAPKQGGNVGSDDNAVQDWDSQVSKRAAPRTSQSFGAPPPSTANPSLGYQPDQEPGLDDDSANKDGTGTGTDKSGKDGDNTGTDKSGTTDDGKCMTAKATGDVDISGDGKTTDSVMKRDGYSEFAADTGSVGNGSDGQTFGSESRPNLKVLYGEGAAGDKTPLGTCNAGGTVSTDDTTGSGPSATNGGVQLVDKNSSSDNSTDGTGTNSTTENGSLGDLSDSTVQVCTDRDSTCASNGVVNSVVSVLTGDAGQTPEAAQKIVKGFVALARTIFEVDIDQYRQFGETAGKCGLTASALAASSGGTVAALTNPATAVAALPGLAAMAGSATGVSMTCADATQKGLIIAAALTKAYEANPDLPQAVEFIGVLDPDSVIGQKVFAKLPGSVTTPEVLNLFRSVVKVGYALNKIPKSDTLSKYANGAGSIAQNNLIGGIPDLIFTSLTLSNQVVTALSGSDPEKVSGGLGSAMSTGTFGSSSVLTGMADPSKKAKDALPSATDDKNSYKDMKVGDDKSAGDFTSSYVKSLLS